MRERFFSKTMPEPNTGCLLWTARTNRYGYGEFQIATGTRPGRKVSAHRVAWELRYGPIPGGLWVLHRCDTPPCVNVEHLFLGTAADNMTDKTKKGRQARTPRKLHPDAIKEIGKLRSTGMSQQKIADLLGVSQPTISAVLLGKIWKPEGKLL